MIGQHGYNQEQTDKGYMNDTVQQYDVGGKQVWMPETAYASSSDVTQIYVDQHNYAPSWGPVFYSLGGLGTSCSGADTLLCSNDQVTYTVTAFGTAFQQAYYPH